MGVDHRPHRAVEDEDAVVEDLLDEVACGGHRGRRGVGHVGSGSGGPGRRAIAGRMIMALGARSVHPRAPAIDQREPRVAWSREQEEDQAKQDEDPEDELGRRGGESVGQDVYPGRPLADPVAGVLFATEEWAGFAAVKAMTLEEEERRDQSGQPDRHDPSSARRVPRRPLTDRERDRDADQREERVDHEPLIIDDVLGPEDRAGSRGPVELGVARRWAWGGSHDGCLVRRFLPSRAGESAPVFRSGRVGGEVRGLAPPLPSEREVRASSSRLRPGDHFTTPGPR